jgi:signal transduction histidine kinase
LQNEKVGAMNEEQNVLVESIKEDAGRLLKITDELLNLTQVDSGNIQLSILPADPAEIFGYAVNANKVYAEQKHIQLMLECPENIPKAIADSEKTAWVLTNLISNAIRYSHDNSEIKLKVEQQGKKIAFSVRDSGQGIAPEYRAKIFDRYFRVPGTQKEGTGLGLAISKEFIEAQGGSIAVESEYMGQGALLRYC